MCKNKYPNRMVRNSHFLNSGTPVDPSRKHQLWRRKSPASSLATCSEAVACAATPPGKTRKISKKIVLQELVITCDYKKTKLMFIKWIPVENAKYSNRLVRNHHFINSGTPLEPASPIQHRETRAKDPFTSKMRTGWFPAVRRGGAIPHRGAPMCAVSLPVKGIDTETGGEKKSGQSN